MVKRFYILESFFLYKTIRIVQNIFKRGYMMKMNAQKKKFAHGFCFTKIFIFFILGCLFGGLFEETILFFQNGKWTSRHDMIYGPFSTLYGFGFAIYLLVFLKGNEKRGIIKTFILASLLGGVIEYSAGLFSENFLGIKFWDYSNMALNIHGRTTIPIMIIWGIGGTIILKVFYPFVSNFIEKIPYKIGNSIFIFLLVFMITNMTISYSAFLRMVFRNRGEAPKTIIGEIYDKVYNDEFMLKKFPILEGKF